MSWIVPKFVYPVDGVGNVEFIPTYPPTDKLPVDALSAVREDSITTSGIQQSVLSRIDRLQTLNFVTVPQEELSDWSDFLSYALTGGAFAYHPDSISDDNAEYVLVDTAWNYKRSGYRNFAFTLNLRKVIPTTVGS